METLSIDIVYVFTDGSIYCRVIIVIKGEGSFIAGEALLCFTLYKCVPATILNKGLWPTVSHLVHTRGLHWQ